MALELYRKKRDFKKTPEPPPAVPKKKGASFCVQKHAATRLHYDFRLELDGVLLSWAVTKGPSLDPADKRLAVRTEDHPVAYGGFEGTIPQGEYGGGTVMLWDEGSWVPEGDPRAGLKKGHLTFELQGHRMKGRWTLVRMHTKDKRENWLLIKDKDEESATGRKAEAYLVKNASSVKTGRRMEEIAEGNSVWHSNRARKKEEGRKPEPRKKSGSAARLVQKYRGVQLATLVTDPPQGEEWIHEIKYDGYRILCFVDGGDVKIHTRNGNDWTHKFPAVAAALARLPVDNAVLDGEAVMLDEKGLSGFQELQYALSEEGDVSQIQAYFFDLLHIDGEDITGLPLLERKQRLETLMKGVKQPLHYSEHLEGSKDILQRACKMGLEGLISKKGNAPYTQGRGKSWLKSKCNKRQEFVIIGYAKSKSGPRAIGALLLAYTSENELVYAGKVGTGFTHDFAAEVLEKLKPLEIPASAVKGVSAAGRRGAIWVKPKILCEVSFTEWTVEGHVRHPSFEGLREDKKPAQVKKEVPKETEDVTEKATKGDLIAAGIKITHPERLLFDNSKVTKGDLAQYYAAVAPYMLKQIKGKPISLVRCPSGSKQKCFYQRNPDAHMKKHVTPFRWKHKGTVHEYLYIEDAEGLVFLAQMGVIEIHPWGAPAKKIDYPERLIFDLDPDEGVPFEAVKLAAQDVRARLKRLKLQSFVKTSGGKGLHIIVPLSGKQKWPEVKAFAAAFAENMAAEVPDAYVATMTKAKRKGKIFIDYFRNDYTATAIADYSVRARTGAPVSVPLEWNELKRLKAPNAFTPPDVLKRLKKKKPPKGLYDLRQTLPEI